MASVQSDRSSQVVCVPFQAERSHDALTRSGSRGRIPRTPMHRNPGLRQVMDTALLKGTLSLLILSLLSRKVMYGYEIAETVHSDTDGAFTWREGSLYPSLHKLEQDGLIVGEWEEKESGRKRRYYHITKHGRAALAEKRRSWADMCIAVNRILEKSHG